MSEGMHIYGSGRSEEDAPALATSIALQRAKAHQKLGAEVFVAYGWPMSLTDTEQLERLLALNH